MSIVWKEMRWVFRESQDDEQIIERVAALDIGKAEVVCCVRLPGPAGGKHRVQEVTTHSSMTRSLTELANRLVELGVTRVVMEATSDYWKPPFYLLEAHGLTPWLVNAKDVKHLPGRPKTDLLTELASRSLDFGLRRRSALARFRSCDQRRGCATGAVRLGGAAARLA
ncbi:MAG: IS110 family transposase [Ornithinimicrobium sp.]|uniref:IS110 family transposase n=1 Tax=Ornithinimicrobium sp. TaxID=1977084 RepID=UPI003D9AC242